MCEANGPIAIQGYEGSFHQVAARRFFGPEVEIVTCPNFREVVKITSSIKQSGGGVMAIENSIAGSILPNYNLLQKSNLCIIGEIYLQIRQQLLVNPGVKLMDIREVQSHPMAIQQCLKYLDQFDWKLIETDDTALSARQIHQHHSKHAAGIASKLAADLFGLEILAPNIHTMKNNYTRFLIIRHEDQAGTVEGADKASVNFYTDHSKGSLAKVLTAIAGCGINLSKLQSFPIPGSNWQYSFHADMEFESFEQFEEVIEIMAPITAGLRVYGVYKKGITVPS